MRILVIEDEPGVARGVQVALEADGFAVDVETDGYAGLVAARTGAHDLIVLDLMVPTMNGYRVCAALRDEGRWTPILMLTAKAGEYDIAEGLETGADDYLTKPFSTVVLVARVRALLRRPRPEGRAPFEVGDVRLDPATHRCWRGATEIELTAREMDVLVHLLSHPGETVSKTQLIDNVWGESFTGDLNIVEVYVARLRRKLGRDGQRPEVIETVRGVGYRVCA